jgi:hypothetical protein
MDEMIDWLSMTSFSSQNARHLVKFANDSSVSTEGSLPSESASEETEDSEETIMDGVDPLALIKASDAQFRILYIQVTKLKAES